jgi:hypothetical protein
MTLRITGFGEGAAVAGEAEWAAAQTWQVADSSWLAW